MPESPASDQVRRYLRLQMADGIGPILARRLIDHFETIDAVLSASPGDLAGVEGIGRERARALAEARDDPAVDREIELAAKLGIRIVCLDDAEYPHPLRHINDPPLCLYIRGRLEPEDAIAIAVVGSRKCTRYGAEQAERFGAALASAGFTVISGLARGVDGAAQRGAVAAGGRSIAVLGNGLATVYPPEHGELAMQVAARGAVLSELPLETPPEASNFPHRNRIIAGLGLGVLVIEAAHRSGARITARLASEYNREVFAVPGRVDTPTAHGVNAMIRDGQAKLVTCLQDILDDLGDVGRMMAPADADPPVTGGTGSSEPPGLTPDESTVWGALGEEAVELDEVAHATKLRIETVAAILTRLQLRGAVTALPGQRFERRKRD